MSSFNEWSKLILKEIKRFDQNHRDVMASLDKIKEEQHEQSNTLIRNTASLEEHIRRTEILERLHEENVRRIDEIDERLDEAEKPQIAISAIKKLIIGIGSVAAAAAAIIKFLDLI
jgi:DNA repair exonuclease SbcCD ATPase subunit